MGIPGGDSGVLAPLNSFVLEMVAVSKALAVASTAVTMIAVASMAIKGAGWIYCCVSGVSSPFSTHL